MSCPHAYMCTLSNRLRTLTQRFPGAQAALKEAVEAIVNRIAGDPTLVAQLQVPIPQLQAARPLHLRDGAGKLLYKTWTAWNAEQQLWWVWLEEADDAEFELSLGFPVEE